MDRPAEPDQAPDGFHWEVVPDTSLRWRVIEDGDSPVAPRRCRMSSGRGKSACGRDAVAELNRGIRVRRPLVLGGTRQADSWWAYCGRHLYGRWIEGGTVMHWVLRENQ
jgi:hypothetical protein